MSEAANELLEASELRAALARRREPLWERARQLLRRGEGGSALAARVGLKLGREHARVFDELLSPLFDAVVARRRGGADGLALAGVGGYGRGALGLGSDVDLRLVVEDRDAATSVAEALLHPLWDASVAVGHQVETVDRLVGEAAKDLPTATSLLDWRPIKGDPALGRLLQQKARARLLSPARLPDLLRRLEAEVTQRYRRFGGSVYLLEPDVKNGPGALRDLDVAFWAGRARWGARTLAELGRGGVLADEQLEAVREARELLWRIRNLLHATAGRRSDRLSFEQQEQLARVLGYPGELREAVERFMSDYYRAARTIARFRDMVVAAAFPAPTRPRGGPRDLGGGIRLFDGTVMLADSASLERDPALALRLVSAAVDHRVPLRPGSRNALVKVSADPDWGRRLRQSGEAAERFVALLTHRAETALKAGSVAGELHDVGLLLAMVPEFAPLVGRVHHDTYHVYTVDVHSVAAVARLAEIFRGQIATDEHEEPRWAGSLAFRLATEVTRPRVLFLAALLHDLGKAIGRQDHARRGAEMAPPILERLGFSSADVADVCSLIAHHLSMLRVATRRDLDDPQTVAEFAHSAGSHEGLRHLYLLAVADLSTTSPTSMSSWKARMLDELFIAADEVLRGGPSSEQPRLSECRERVRAAVDAAPPSGEASAVERAAFVESLLDSMPERYLLSNPPEAIAAHAELVRRHGTEGASVALVPSRHPEAAEICVVARDRPGLLAAITAALSAHRLHVDAAQIHSRLRGPLEPDPGTVQAVDLFWVRDPSGGVSEVPAALDRVRRSLERALAGQIQPAQLVAGQSRRARGEPEVPTRITIDNRASPGHTVIEVIARDRPGLLFALADTIYRQGLSIAVAKITTEGTRATDVFYVSEQSGTKVALKERAASLRQALLTRVTPKGTDESR